MFPRSAMGLARRALVSVSGHGQGRGWGCRALSDQPFPADLKRTVDTYLDYVRQLEVPADCLSHTEQLSEQFLKWPGPDLQLLFQKFAEEHTNWLSYQWQVDHLSNRHSLLTEVSGSFCPAPTAIHSLHDQLWLAAHILSALLDLKWKLDNGAMGVQRIGGVEQCMNRFQYAYSSCRVPAVSCDRFVVYPSYPPAARHVNVLYRDEIFSVDVYGDDDGRALSTEQLYEQLRKVTEQRAGRTEEPVGVLTALPRDLWASVYQDLVQDENNRAVMDNIQRSLFVLCLDQPVPPSPPPPPTTDPTTPTTGTLTTTTTITPLRGHTTLTATQRRDDLYQLYYGGGVDLNSCNRWLDKGTQVVVGANGMWGMQTEHSAVDGTHCLLIIDHVEQFMKKGHSGRNVGVTRSQVKSPTRLQLNLTAKTWSAIEEAKQHVTS
ncbi:carnitine O-acetyltransferase-like [Babylonia areolata]|uniref:carnitine O-acetyltransferase-like n=1 Tax=Babylonia areolata TaxID=304850 RepID=UPI003FD22D22